MSSTPLFKGSDVPTKLLAHGSNLGRMALPAATNDLYGYQQDLHPANLGPDFRKILLPNTYNILGNS